MICKDQIECYQAIGAALAKAAPGDWREIKAEIILEEIRVDAIVSYTRQSGPDVGYITGVPMLANYFHQLAALLRTKEKGLFKKCFFTLNSDGKYDAQFSY